MAATPIRHMRVSDPEWDRWKAEAKAEGLTVTAWVLERCKPRKAKPNPAKGRRAIATPERAASTNRVKKLLTLERPICDHPKGALVPLAAGLARCGRCGSNRRADGTWTT